MQRMDFNFFNISCFFYAVLAISSSLVRMIAADRFTRWEKRLIENEEKPFWVFVTSLFTIMYILILWFMVWKTAIAYGWILALLLSFTLLKSSLLIIDYQRFRRIAASFIQNKHRKRILNILIFVFGIGLLLIGLFLY